MVVAENRSDPGRRAVQVVEAIGQSGLMVRERLFLFDDLMPAGAGGEGKMNRQVDFHVDPTVVVFGIVVVIFLDGIFKPENLFNDNFNDTFLVVERQVFGNMFGFGVLRIDTDVEHMKRHEPPEELNEGAISQLTYHGAN